MQTISFDLLRRRQVYPKQAALKRGASIEYVSMNRIFTDADDYSMEIELPLADCPQNLDIFANAIETDQGSQGIGYPLKSQRTSIEAVRFGGSRDGIAPTNPSAPQK